MLMRYLLLLVSLLLSGCSSSPSGTGRQATADDDASAQDSGQLVNHQEGGLYSDYYMFTLFADKRAYSVGDILTVVLAERTMSSKSADSSLGKDSSWDVGVPLLGTLNTNDMALKTNSATGFKGQSTANQQNSLSGYISVRVIDVLPNGALRIKGRKQIRLNQGDEYLELSGVVRPEDIDVTNQISSQRIAEASISYEGSGTLADASEPGWLTKLFTRYLNPF
ncbi:flagellar basal body L-ring protein FlgH [Shewanella fodinae]|uniref:Flagellar L-ring protein n=1 Tax=Shewanella fodinae TaxID=552357 RepID=A0A4R2F7Q4_9GAMM|nr:flagellar basal body L-ring protein FlgH [Shewanella fodinae]TCN81722.1 flagellar L-ring protein precursor FlgH [Shewanella fodinae]